MAIDVKAFKEDYNWRAAFHEALLHRDESWADEKNPHPIDPVTEVFACVEGENDGDNWAAIVFMGSPHNAYAVMEAGCDYTGWDCQASGVIDFFQDLDTACSNKNLTNDQRKRLEPQLRELAATGRVTLDW